MPQRKKSGRRVSLQEPTAHVPLASGLSVPPPGYAKCAVPVAILMADFVMEHLHRLYQRFDGDLLLPILLGEIGHHNFSHFFTARGAAAAHGRAPDLADLARIEAAMLPCNAFSLSAATGIPRETVRRKIAELVKRGWVCQNPKGQVFLTQKPAQDFLPEFNVVTLNRLLETARKIEGLLAKAD